MDQMKLRVACHLSFQIDANTALILMLRPYQGNQQWIIHEHYEVNQLVQVLESRDSFGNACQRLVAPVGDFNIIVTADVRIYHQPTNYEHYFVEIQCLPAAILLFLLPSRYCESDRLTVIAHEIIGDALPGFQQVIKIVQWLQATIRYLPGSSEYPLSAIEIYHQGFGVCRDLAHLGIALCRSISIPARIVVGYLEHLEPMDMHAWFEVYIGHQWQTFDPICTDEQAGRVVVAYGRDAADVSVFHQFGSGALLTNMVVTVNRVD